MTTGSPTHFDECHDFLNSLKSTVVGIPTDKVRNFTRVLQDLEHKMSLLEKVQLDYYAGFVDERTYVSTAFNGVNLRTYGRFVFIFPKSVNL